MGFRNPVTSAVDQTARDLANEALTQIIPGSRLAADAIDGRTINGVTINAGSLDTGSGSAYPGTRVYSGSSSTLLEMRDGTGNPRASLRLLSTITTKIINNTYRLLGAGIDTRTTDLPYLTLATVTGIPAGSTSATLHADAITLDGLVNGEDGAWINLTYQNSWVPYNTSTYPPARCRRLRNGQVEVQGLSATGTPGNGLPAFTLPAGYAPAKRLMFPAIGNGVLSRVDVDPSGAVYIMFGSTTYNSHFFTFTPS